MIVIEHQCFLDWLLLQIQTEDIDVLLVSGDIFDSANPSSASQKQLYRFLLPARTIAPHLRIVLIAGNHDSPRLQNARSALFAGRAIADVEAQLEQSLADAKNRVQTASADTSSRQTRRTACQEACTQALNLFGTRQAQLADAEQALLDWLSAFNQAIDAANRIDLPQLRQWLARDRIWINSERQALDRLKDSLKQAQAILNKRRLQYEVHLQTRATLETLENLQIQLTGLEADITALQNQRTELDLQLRTDDERLKLGAECRAKLQPRPLCRKPGAN